ncbi:STAS domain-containing protein [Catellatospora sp. NPDC049609]|uniref:STAS domain-containing protein n=1 Tax=Catellatospora sp. NPDC049609 TaxID=3155505 RepID=UPI0034216C16
MSITVTLAPTARVAMVRIKGDVDLLDPRDVNLARRRLAFIPPAGTVHVDLSGVTFGGSALVHYLAELARRAMPAALHVYGARGMTGTVLDMARMGEVAVLHGRTESAPHSPVCP